MSTSKDAMIDKCKSEASDGRQWFPVGPVIQCIYNNCCVGGAWSRRIVIQKDGRMLDGGSGNEFNLIKHCSNF